MTKSRWKNILLVALVTAWLGPEPALAQFEGEASEKAPETAEEEAGGEQLYQQEEQKQEQFERQLRVEQRKKTRELPKVESVSELSGLAPFEDIAVIQRKFLPRTGRFELAGSGMGGLNNPFFNSLGINIRGSYFFTEKIGIEGIAMFFSPAETSVTENLRTKQQVQTQNLVTAKSFYGLAAKWVPIYGKIGFLNRKIVPFDLYFSGGLGLTQTQKQGEFTYHISTGQSFAITKSVAFRWDLIWNFYNATVDSVKTVGGTEQSFNSDLFLSIGVSYFMPEATYR